LREDFRSDKDRDKDSARSRSLPNHRLRSQALGHRSVAGLDCGRHSLADLLVDYWLGGLSYREAKGGDIRPQPFWQARYYDFKLWI